jgi:hypothetical protein
MPVCEKQTIATLQKGFSCLFLMLVPFVDTKIRIWQAGHLSRHLSTADLRRRHGLST